MSGGKMSINDFVRDYLSWIFSGVGVTIVGLLYSKYSSKKPKIAENQSSSIKSGFSILFIDDDTEFQVVKILKKSGWTSTETIPDLETIVDVRVQNANVIFVDIKGVGRLMRFHDEGLGLARAIKKKYPEKFVVIYSAEEKHDAFNPAIREVDRLLSKNADPYEFEQLIDEVEEKMRGVS